MYDREYDGKIINFEASGGLYNNALVMQDVETDTYWSIVTGDAIGGRLKGTRLREIPVGWKMQFKDWVELYPDTLVLSIQGREDVPFDPYQDYFRAETGFRGSRASDRRMSTMAPIYAFEADGVRYAVPFEAVEEGKVFEVGGEEILFFRPARSEIFYSSAVFRSGGDGFEKRDGHWVDRASGAVFNPERGVFEGEEHNLQERLNGFDTFWYIWSDTHPDTRILQ